MSRGLLRGEIDLQSFCAETNVSRQARDIIESTRQDVTSSQLDIEKFDRLLKRLKRIRTEDIKLLMVI